MSCNWEVNGYGVAEEDIKVIYDEEDVDALLKKAPTVYKKIREQMKKDGHKFYEDIEHEDGTYGIMPVITKAVREIENISLEYHQGENGNFILFPPFYPWNSCMDNDKSMTVEKLDGIYRKYFGTEGDYVSAQYQG